MADKEKLDMKQVEKDVKERLEAFQKRKSDVAVEELISEDRQDYKDLLRTTETLKEMVTELLEASKAYAAENEKLRHHLQEGRDTIAAQYYKQKLTQSGILK